MPASGQRELVVSNMVGTRRPLSKDLASEVKSRVVSFMSVERDDCRQVGIVGGNKLKEAGAIWASGAASYGKQRCRSRRARWKAMIRTLANHQRSLVDRPGRTARVER